MSKKPIVRTTTRVPATYEDVHEDWTAEKIRECFGDDPSCIVVPLLNKVEALERQRDEAREHSRKWCDDFTKLEPELRRMVEFAKQCQADMVEFAKQCQAERDEARADRDQFRVLWERDSRSLSDVIGQRNTARTVAEDNRARYVTAEHERDEALEALRELLSDVTNDDDDWIAGSSVQRARALLAELDESNQRKKVK